MIVTPPIIVEPMIMIVPIIVPVVPDVVTMVLPPIVPAISIRIGNAVGAIVGPISGPPLFATAALSGAVWSVIRTQRSIRSNRRRLRRADQVVERRHHPRQVVLGR